MRGAAVVFFLIALTVSQLARADCASPSAAAGVMIYNIDHTIMQYCNGTDWIAMPGLGVSCAEGDTIVMTSSGWGCSTGDPPPTGCDNIGDVCSDGSVYAGLSPDGDVKMYTTPADAGTFKWNGDHEIENSVMEDCTDSTPGTADSCRTGEANTDLLATMSAVCVGDVFPYYAADHCAALTDHDRDDWYLPAQDELDVLYQNSAAIGGFNTSGSYYWSSSEAPADEATGRRQRFSDGAQNNNGRADNNHLVRCVRKD